MAALRQIVQSNLAILGPTYRTLSALGAITMVGASIGIFMNPILMSSNIGLPITRGPEEQSKSTKTIDDHSKTKTLSISDTSTLAQKAISPHAPGWMVVFAGRNVCLGLGMLALNALGEMRALSVVGQLTTIGGLADSLATYWYGTSGSYRGHLIPTLVMSWMGPLGLLLYL